MSVAMPKDTAEMQGMLKAALRLGGPKAIRWPRGSAEPSQAQDYDAWPAIEWGTWELLKDGKDAFVLALGPTLAYALEATRGNDRVGVVNARFVKPIDRELLEELAARSKLLITTEDHALHGGLGTAVAETLADLDQSVRLIRLGIPDEPVPHGDPNAQHEAFGYGPTGIKQILAEFGMEKLTPLAEASD